MPDSEWPEWDLASVLAGRPAVRVNQLGYLPLGPKQATWVDHQRVAASRVQGYCGRRFGHYAWRYAAVAGAN
jgi:hypothetical protein